MEGVRTDKGHGGAGLRRDGVRIEEERKRGRA